MDGHSVNTYKWVNDRGDVHFVRYTLKADLGAKWFTA